MNFGPVFLYSMLAGAATLFGTYLVFCYEAWARRNSILLISFAAGVMLTISFTHLLPEAAGLSPTVWTGVFGGFLGFYVLQYLIMFHPCHEEHCHVRDLGILSSVGLAIHSLMDGVAITIGFQADPALGILTTVAVILHEVPEGIIITSLLLHANANRKKIILLSAVVAFATPLGAILTFFLLRDIAPHLLGTLLAITAGTFIYLAASDLLPETHRKRERINALFFFIGVAVIQLTGHFLE